MARKKLKKVDSEGAAAAPLSRAWILALVGPVIAVLATFLWRRLRAPAWRSPTGALAGFEDAGARCGIAIVHASNFSRARFEREFQEQQPVLVRGLTADVAARREWDFGPFHASFGAHEGNLAIPLVTSQFGPNGNVIDGNAATLGAHLGRADDDDGAALLFDRTDGELARRLLAAHGTPPALAPIAPPAARGQSAYARVVSVGGPDAGLTLHFHGQTWLSLLRGVKLWFLLPPGGVDDHPEGASLLFARPSAWADKARLFAARGGARAPHVCEQRAGDVVYVPSLWYHATLNDGDALALGVQQTGHWTSEAHMRALFGRYPNISYVRYARADQEFFALLAQNPAAPATAGALRAALATMEACVAAEPHFFERRVEVAEKRAILSMVGGRVGSPGWYEALDAELAASWAAVASPAEAMWNDGEMTSAQFAALLVRLARKANNVKTRGGQATFKKYSAWAARVDKKTVAAFKAKKGTSSTSSMEVLPWKGIKASDIIRMGS